MSDVSTRLLWFTFIVHFNKNETVNECSSWNYAYLFIGCKCVGCSWFWAKISISILWESVDGVQFTTNSIIHLIIIGQFCHISFVNAFFIKWYVHVRIRFFFFPKELVVCHLLAPHWVWHPVDKYLLVSIPTWDSIPSTLGQSVLLFSILIDTFRLLSTKVIIILISSSSA